MDKIYVVYWSQTGNTQAMAEAIGKGITAAGKEAKVVCVGEASIEELKNAECFALGCPAMGAEVLEESEMELSNPASVSMLSGERKPRFRFLGNHHSRGGNHYYKYLRM